MWCREVIHKPDRPTKRQRVLLCTLYGAQVAAEKKLKTIITRQEADDAIKAQQKLAATGSSGLVNGNLMDRMKKFAGANKI